jgi:O-antigen/teichoic acid export membrane protein
MIAEAAGALSARLRSEPSIFWGRFLGDLRFCLPFALSSWIAILANRAGALVFSNTSNGTALALANLALNIAALTQMFGWALNNSENPKVLNGLLAAEPLTNRHLETAFARLALASHLAVIGCYLSLFAAIIYALFSTTRWDVSLPLFGYIALFAILKFLLDVVGTFLQYDFLYLSGKLGLATLAKTVLVVLQIPILGYLAGRYGIHGALIGYLVTSLLNFLPGEVFLGREYLRRRLAVYGRHAVACLPFLLLLLARTRPALIALTAFACLLAAGLDLMLAPRELRERLAKFMRIGLRTPAGVSEESDQ